MAVISVSDFTVKVAGVPLSETFVLPVVHSCEPSRLGGNLEYDAVPFPLVPTIQSRAI
jgi:hypothetical protein